MKTKHFYVLVDDRDLGWTEIVCLESKRDAIAKAKEYCVFDYRSVLVEDDSKKVVFFFRQ